MRMPEMSSLVVGDVVISECVALMYGALG